MELIELFRRLSYGELSNLALGGEGSGAITESLKPRVITYANEGLLRLHTRFQLRESLLTFKQIAGLTYYYMLKRYAVSQTGTTQYIIDTVDEPFEEDLLKVLAVHDLSAQCETRPDSEISPMGWEVPLNDIENPLSIFTPQPNLIQVPFPVADRIYGVTYQARHPVLVIGDDDQEIDLPFALEGALTKYIAYSVYSHMNGQENAIKAKEHLDQYDRICMEVNEQDLVSQSKATTLTKFDSRGFI